MVRLSSFLLMHSVPSRLYAPLLPRLGFGSTVHHSIRTDLPLTISTYCSFPSFARRFRQPDNVTRELSVLVLTAVFTQDLLHLRICSALLAHNVENQEPQSFERSVAQDELLAVICEGGRYLMIKWMASKPTHLAGPDSCSKPVE
jgi:hypothetical protein